MRNLLKFDKFNIHSFIHSLEWDNHMLNQYMRIKDFRKLFRQKKLKKFWKHFYCKNFHLALCGKKKFSGNSRHSFDIYPE